MCALCVPLAFVAESLLAMVVFSIQSMSMPVRMDVCVSVYGYLDECLYVAFIRAYANTIESFAGSSVTF